MTVRTRVAPSPTGDPHVGTAYIALFNYVFAKAQGGDFILRIEDTDQVRSTLESEQQILDSLKWLGLSWDEGPDIGGSAGQYRQSERQSIYQEYAQQLIDAGHAFYCFATPEELDELRKHQLANKLPLGYDGRGLTLSPGEVKANLKQGIPYVIRMKIPEEGTCQIQDRLRGNIDIEWSQVDMQVLMKADGMPTYHLANVVDDHLMGITHVIRGEEWISSAPKHKLLYEYFGWDMPELIHLPLLRNPDKSKLSKRKNPTSITYYQKLGILPEALLNYLGRMGWSMPNEEEKFTLSDMMDNFSIDRVSLGGPVFDMTKLKWLNGLWMRESLDNEAFLSRFSEWLSGHVDAASVVQQIKPRIETFSDVMPKAGFLYAGSLELDVDSFSGCSIDQETLVTLFQYLAWSLDGMRQWNRDALFQECKFLADAMELKIRDFLQPVFIAVTGSTSSFSVVDAMEILGPDMTRARIREAANLIGMPGKKKLKKMESTYKTLKS